MSAPPALSPHSPLPLHRRAEPHRRTRQECRGVDGARRSILGRGWYACVRAQVKCGHHEDMGWTAQVDGGRHMCQRVFSLVVRAFPTPRMTHTPGRRRGRGGRRGGGAWGASLGMTTTWHRVHRHRVAGKGVTGCTRCMCRNER